MISWAFDRKYKGWLIFRYADPDAPKMKWRAEYKNYQWEEVEIDMTLRAPTLSILKDAINIAEFKK